MKIKMPLFGPAGRGDSFAECGFKHMKDVPDYLAKFQLTAYEYQCGHGVRVNKDTMAIIKEKSSAMDIACSLHAPYYISMASMEEEKRQNSVNYLLQSAQAVRMLGGNRVIFHCGGVGKQARSDALKKVEYTLQVARESLDEQGYSDIHLCPETMGKSGQIGDLDEILQLCKTDKRHIPCLDFGHLNALTQGSIRTKEDYKRLTDRIGEVLADDRATFFHVHFSKIEYTKAGEKKHLTFDDTVFGPPWEPFVEMLAENGLAPVVICESSGTQTEDVKTMQLAYQDKINK